MCTVTFVPKADGFLLAMNRDDAYSRAETTPPLVHTLDDSRALFPSEINGGTWIAANDSGLAFCLLNWNRPVLAAKTRSRGEIIPAIAHATSLEQLAVLMHQVPSDGLHPFRLIAFSLPEQSIREWRVHAPRDHRLSLGIPPLVLIRCRRRRGRQTSPEDLRGSSNSTRRAIF